MYLELNWNMSAVSMFSIIDIYIILFYAKQYHLVYYNKQQVSSHSVVSLDISMY